MDWEQRGETAYGAIVRFGNKNRLCKFLALPALWVGWRESTMPEEADNIFPVGSHKQALVRLGGAALAMLLVLALTVGSVIYILSANNTKDASEDVSADVSSQSAAEVVRDSGAEPAPQPPQKEPSEQVNEGGAAKDQTTVKPAAAIPYAAPQATVAVPAPLCACTSRCKETAVNDDCPICKEAWENCAYQVPAKTSTYSELLSRYRELARWYDKIADNSNAIDDDGCIKNKTNRRTFIADFDELETQTKKLEETTNEDIYERLEKERVYERLLELYELMRDYKDDSSSSSSSTPGGSPAPEKPSAARLPTCKTVPDAGGFYCVYANGTPITISANPSGGTSFSWSGGSYSYNASQGANLAVFGGFETTPLNGSTSITMTGGTVKAMFGGGNWFSGTSAQMVSGTASIQINGGVVLGDVYGGGNNSGASVGSVNMKMTGGEVRGNVFGGGMLGRVNGSVEITLDGSAKIGNAGNPDSGYVSGGGYAGTVAGNKIIKLAGASTVTSGIDLSGVTGGAVQISGALTGSDGSIKLISPTKLPDGTAVARPVGNIPPTATPFSLAGSGLAVLDAQVKVANVYTVTLDQQGGVGDASVLVQYGGQFPPSVTPPTRENYSFGGYYLQPDGGGAQYYAATGVRVYDKLWTASAGVTLYAKWTQNVTTLLIEPNGGDWSAEKTVTQKAGTVLPLADPKKEDALFTGWEVEGHGGMPVGQSFLFGPESGTVSLTAQWLENPDDKLTTEVEVQSGHTGITATGLNRLFTAEDLLAEQVQIQLAAADADTDTPEAADIIRAAGDERLTLFDFTVKKITTIGGESQQITLADLPSRIEITLDLTGELAGHADYAVYRSHSGKTEQLPQTPSADGDYYTVLRSADKDSPDRLVIHASQFSVYGVAGLKNARNARSALSAGADGLGSKSTDVQAQVLDGTSGTYKLDISWGAMKFDFNAAGMVWNPDTHSYTPGGTQGWTNESFEKGNNKITVANHSNGDVTLDYLAVPNASLSGVTMKVRTTNSSAGIEAQDILLQKVPTEAAEAPTVDTYVWLSGTPTDLVALTKESYTKAGVITVTAAADMTGGLTPKNP